MYPTIPALAISWLVLTFQEPSKPAFSGTRHKNGLALYPLPNFPSSNSSYLCPSGRGGCPRLGCWAGTPFTSARLTSSGGRCREGAERRAHSVEAAEKVGVGVSQSRRRRRKKEVGELRRISPSCQLSVSRRGREEANWFVAQNSRWGIESWKMTAGKLLRNQAHLRLPFRFSRRIN